MTPASPSRPPRASARRRALYAVVLVLIACQTLQSQPAPPLGPPAIAGIIIDPSLSEISGLAVSRRHVRTLWAINDSGNGAEIVALSQTGGLRSVVKVTGATNIDWEDLAGFTRDGRHFLLIADAGDNGGARETLDLWLVEEPASLDVPSVPVHGRLRFRWPDGARDCEAMAVDEASGDILLLSKRRVPAQLFRLPLDALFVAQDPDSIAVAEEIAQVLHLPQPTAEELAREPRLGRYRAQITGVAFREDGLFAVQTYRDTYLYRRASGTRWRETLSRPPRALGVTFLPQAEATAFDPVTGDLFVASERIPTPLLRLHSRDGASLGPPPVR